MAFKIKANVELEPFEGTDEYFIHPNEDGDYPFEDIKVLLEAGFDFMKLFFDDPRATVQPSYVDKCCPLPHYLLMMGAKSDLMAYIIDVLGFPFQEHIKYITIFFPDTIELLYERGGSLEEFDKIKGKIMLTPPIIDALCAGRKNEPTARKIIDSWK